MRPTSRCMMEQIAEALEETVLPAAAHDRWAASTVRSAVTLLRHLGKRVELEPAVLVADAADARGVLEDVASTAATVDPGLGKAICDLLAQPPAEGVDIRALEAQDHDLQSLVDRLLRLEGQAEIRNTVLAYLQRRLERERDVFLPELAAPPF